MAEKSLHKFLELVFGKNFNNTDELIEVRKFIGNSKKRYFYNTFEDVIKCKERSQNENVYLGVYSRAAEAAEATGKIGKEYVRTGKLLFADMDFKDYEGGAKEATKVLQEFPLKPSIVVHTGNGFHIYWLLKEDLCDIHQFIGDVEALLKGISKYLGADMTVAEVARILRIPETKNWKNPSSPKDVNIITMKPERFYDIEEFQQFEISEEERETVITSDIDVADVTDKCGFLQYALENRMPEPLWHAMLSNLVRLRGGRDLCHLFSHNENTSEEIDAKILHVMNGSAAITCKRIKYLLNANDLPDCGGTEETCPWKSPAGNILTDKQAPKQAIEEYEEEAEDIKSMEEVASAVVQFVEFRMQTPDELSGVPSGIATYDDITDGFQKAEVNILGARPSIGKTALMLNMAIFSARRGFPIGIAQFEMKDIFLGLRLLAVAADVNIRKMRKGLITKEELYRIKQAKKELEILPIYFDFFKNTDVECAKTIDTFVNKYGCSMIYVDHLHLMSTKEQKFNRELELSSLSQLFKRKAGMHNIPICLLAQLNRANVVDNRRPQLSDLRGSGSLEQDGDNIMFLHPDDPENSPDKVTLYLEKGKNCGTGVIPLRFNKEQTLFGELEPKVNV